MRALRGFYFITDANLSRNGILADVRAALDGGAVLVQYRSRQSRAATWAEARDILALCGPHRLVVNDHVELAVALGSGLHVGQLDMEAREARQLLARDALLGVSVANLDQSTLAVAAGADYLGFGPVWTSSTKPEAGEGLGLESLAQVCAHSPVPVAAIGGITYQRAADCIKAGAAMLCAIAASVGSHNVTAAVRTFGEMMP